MCTFLREERLSLLFLGTGFTRKQEWQESLSGRSGWSINTPQIQLAVAQETNIPDTPIFSYRTFRYTCNGYIPLKTTVISPSPTSDIPKQHSDYPIKIAQQPEDPTFPDFGTSEDTGLSDTTIGYSVTNNTGGREPNILRFRNIPITSDIPVRNRILRLVLNNNRTKSISGCMSVCLSQR